MDLNKLKREGRLVSNHLTRGEIGCYDSHLRLWEHLVKEKIPMALICEDDANLLGNSVQTQYFNTLLDEFKSTSADVLFVSWFRPAGGSVATSHTHVQWCFHQLWAYLVTYQGLVKILNDVKVKKMHVPVDVALWESHSRGVVRNLVAYPPLCLTVGENSDTRHIR
jgi:GR25 family glycosyltransferase involved in LPS biosynthesis